jgi:hypothetical protein
MRGVEGVFVGMMVGIRRREGEGREMKEGEEV